MESFSFTSDKGFDILKLRGDIKVGLLPRLSPALGDHITEHAQQHIVLDLSELTAIDTSIAKLLANMQKRLATNGKKLYLLHTPEAFAPLVTSVGLSDAITDLRELERGLNDDRYRTSLPYSFEELDVRRLQCMCAVCGSRNVAGYLLDQNAYTWGWLEDDFFPSCSHRSGEKFDYFATLPIVCLDCYMVSPDIDHFTLVDKNNAVVRHATLSEISKVHLTKSIIKRKKIVDSCDEASTPNFFLYPRRPSACYATFLLADSCIRTLALNKADADPFQVGFLNYLALRYAERDKKDELIDNCRTWLTQAFNEKKMRTHTERSMAFFILFASALSLAKLKDANAIMLDFAAMMEKISYSQEGHSTVNSPLFWFTQVQTMWRKEIEKKSLTLAKGTA